MSITEALLQVWPPLVLLALILGALELILKKTDWLSGFEAPQRNRLASLDGLRAFLAYGVVFCHIGTFFYFFRGVPWGPHPNPYLHQAGAASVRLFFMITGYLFWGKAISGNGRVDALRLYKNRFWRIMPLYGVLILTVLIIALIETSFRLSETPLKVLREVFELVIPGLQTEGAVNGYEYTEYMRQTWTLKWELVFYILVPLIAIGARNALTFVATALALLFLTVAGRRVFPSLELSITMNFLVGMLAAHLKNGRPDWAFARTHAASVIVIAIALLAPFVIDRSSAYLGNLLYSSLFVFVLYGNDLFGLLTARSSRVLGEVSYSVYLLHMVVLVLFYRRLNSTAPIGELSYSMFWLYSVLPAFAIVILSLFTFQFVERPGIAWSHRSRRAAP
jgi:peptidoglycan/LPS O-acetylase OafA/YrhL